LIMGAARVEKLNMPILRIIIITPPHFTLLI